MSKFDKIFETRKDVLPSLPETETNIRSKNAKAENNLKNLQSKATKNKIPQMLHNSNNSSGKDQSLDKTKKQVPAKIPTVESTIARQAPLAETAVDIVDGGNNALLKQRGRPATGKRTNPEFVGLTTYVRKDTRLRVKIALLQEGQGRELSELVEELLANWVRSK